MFCIHTVELKRNFLVVLECLLKYGETLFMTNILSNVTLCFFSNVVKKLGLKLNTELSEVLPLKSNVAMNMNWNAGN